MPPEVLAAISQTKTWKTRGRPPATDRAGLRDHALLLVGFVGAFRRSEIVTPNVSDVQDHPNGLVLALPRSKTNQTGEQVELVVLPHAGTVARCPVRALEEWLTEAGDEGPVFRAVSRATGSSTVALSQPRSTRSSRTA